MSAAGMAQRLVACLCRLTREVARKVGSVSFEERDRQGDVGTYESFLKAIR